jgi:hypothetical protein
MQMRCAVQNKLWKRKGILMRGLKPSPVPADHPSFMREEVVAVLGANEKLKAAYYVRRRHILSAYGITRHQFRQLVDTEQLTPKHFVFK